MDDEYLRVAFLNCVAWHFCQELDKEKGLEILLLLFLLIIWL